MSVHNNPQFFVGGSSLFPSQIPEEYRNDIRTGITATPITGSGVGDEINPIEYEIIQRVDKNLDIQNYRLFYDAENGSAQVLPVDRNGQLIPEGKPIYANGVWDINEMKSLEGQGQVEPFLNAEERARIDASIKDGIRKNIQATNNKDNPTPEWLKKNSLDFEITEGYVDNAISFEEASFYGNGESYSHAKSKNGIFNIDNARKNVLSSYNPARFAENKDLARDFGIFNRFFNPDFGTYHNISDYDDDNDVMFRRIVKYPMDMASNMDHMFIQCYGYNPPYADALHHENRRGVNDKDTKNNIGFGLARTSPFRKKLGAGIKLPMPNNMMDPNPRMWDDGTMNNASATALQQTSTNPLRAFFTLDGLGLGQFRRRSGQAIEKMQRETGRLDIMANMVSQLSQNMGYDISPETVFSRTVGVVANANTELLFTGVGLRSFEFQWTMSPRDELEAANVRMIIRAFKQWSAPRKLKKMESGSEDNGKAGGPSYFLGTPNIFRLRYVTRDKKDIMGVNKFKPCALTDISVNYTPEGQWMAYDNGMPISLTMTLRFNELEPIYNTDYSDNVAQGRRYDPTDTTGQGGGLGDLFPISIIKENNPYNSEIGY